MSRLFKDFLDLIGDLIIGVFVLCLIGALIITGIIALFVYFL